MEWYEVNEVIQTIAIILILVSLLIILLESIPNEITKKSKKETSKEKEKTKDNIKFTEPKPTTKVVIFYHYSNLTQWFDEIGAKLFNMNVKCNIYRGLRRIEIGNTKIYFMTNYEANETWFTLPKDALYYLTAEYDLNANFDKAFYKIMFTKEDYYDIDGIREVLHL